MILRTLNVVNELTHLFFVTKKLFSRQSLNFLASSFSWGIYVGELCRLVGKHQRLFVTLSVICYNMYSIFCSQLDSQELKILSLNNLDG